MFRRSLAALVLVCTMPTVATAQSAPATPAPRLTPVPATQASPAVVLPPPQALVLPAVPTVAPGYAAPHPPVPNGDIAGVSQQPFVGIQLSDAIAMALSKNSDLAIAQENERIAGYQIVAARGATDVRFIVEPQYSYVQSAPQNAFFSGPNFGPITNQSTGVNTGFSGTTEAGTTYSATISGSQVFNNTAINSFNPNFNTSLNFNLTQPLLKGSFSEVRHTLLLAQANATSTTGNALTTASQTVSNVADAYWDLVAAWRNVAIQEESLQQTELQQQSNERLAKRGTAAPIDVVESNTQVNVFQENVFSALQTVATLQNQLKDLILSNPSDPIWQANLVPTSSVRQLPPQPVLSDVVAEALRNRPEFAQLRGSQAAADANVNYARNQMKPQLDLQAQVESNGFAGTIIPPNQVPFLASSIAQVETINQLIAVANASLPPSQRIAPLPSSAAGQIPPSYLGGNFNQSLNNLANWKFPTYNVGLLFSVPIGDRTARANYGIAQAQLHQTEINEIALIQRVTLESRNAVQNYNSARYRLIAASAARSASEQVLASELRRFRAGVSTTFLVLQRQIELADNRGRELQAQTDLNKAVVELERVTGQILSDNSVDASRIGTGAINPGNGP